MSLSPEEQLEQLLLVQDFLQQWEAAEGSNRAVWVPKYYQGVVLNLMREAYFLIHADRSTYRQRQWALQMQWFLNSKIIETMEIIAMMVGVAGATGLSLYLAHTLSQPPNRGVASMDDMPLESRGAGTSMATGILAHDCRFMDPLAQQEESGPFVQKTIPFVQEPESQEFVEESWAPETDSSHRVAWNYGTDYWIKKKDI